MKNNDVQKLDMKSVDITEENIEKIGNIFPNVIVESEKGKSIDFDLLRQELSKDIVEGNKEKYQLTWPGKKEAILKANKLINKTLRPVKEKSVDFDNTKNIYIEGDNLEALKILQESYLNKIKCIYIDPPYNTGNDFIYNDNFSKEKNDELVDAGQVDEYNNKLVTNNESNGRFHSDWLSMIYPRLKLARNLLKDNGVIFISIDDNELFNMRKICDEIFGEKNFVANFIRKTGSTRAMSINFDIRHDYVLIYSKKIEKIKLNEISKDVENYINFDNDTNGKWLSQDFSVRTGGYFYDIPSIDLSEHFEKNWAKPIEETKIMMGGNPNQSFEEIYKKAKFDKALGWYTLGKFVFKGKNRIINKKKYANETSTLKNHTLYDSIGSNKGGSASVKKLFNTDDEVFSMPKPVELLEYLEYISLNENDIVLDFFSGSATTAHSLMNLCAKDKIKRKYIMVQINELLNKETYGFKNGYKTICEIGEERIKRAAKKIREETNADIDYGFRVYKVDSSNMKDVYYEPSKLNQNQLNMFESNIKEDRTSEDLLTQVILDLGLTLDLKMEEKNILGNIVYFVAENSLVACFDDKINIDILDEICKVKPLKVVFRESSFRNDSDKINAYERIKKLSSETEVNVI